MFSFLQNSLNHSEVKFVPTSDMTLLQIPNSIKVILVACTRSSTKRLATCVKLGICCSNLQYKGDFYISHKYVSSNYFAGFGWYFIVQCSFMWLGVLKP